MAWQISGDYVETCNCDFICPCPTSGLAQSTHGTCTFAMAFRVDEGRFDDVNLAGTSFIVVGRTPGNMIDGNWDVGLIVDAAAAEDQKQALASIASGGAGGPLANLAPLIGNFLGVESRSITFAGGDGNWSVSAEGLIDQGLEGVRGLGGELMALDGVGHPASNKLGLARATHTAITVFGIDFQSAGGNNGHYAPFAWSGA
jgi:hypothetical protein